MRTRVAAEVETERSRRAAEEDCSADPGEDVIVTIAGQRQTAKASEKGKWQVTLDALPVGGPHTLAITGKNKLAVEDVLEGLPNPDVAHPRSIGVTELQAGPTDVAGRR